MSRKLLLWVAALFALFTFAGHTFGALSGPPREQTEVLKVYEVMNETMVTFPTGNPKSISALMLGANLCLSVYLLVSALIFILTSLNQDAPTRFENRILLLNSLGLLGTCFVSAIWFFPIPTICTGASAVLGLIAWRRKRFKV